MNALPRKEWPAQSKVLTLSNDELRRRILAVVNELGQTTEAAIWRSAEPDFLPWDSMIEEIKRLDGEKKLRREVVAPGHILIHSLTNAHAATKPAVTDQPFSKAQTLPSPELSPEASEPPATPPAATKTARPSATTAQRQPRKRTAKARK